ncbi:MAG: hypothetical protein HOP15_09990 [Planctomycetes bacterium]|nr:hypothetical protein [Planctomycetota bacterium]
MQPSVFLAVAVLASGGGAHVRQAAERAVDPESGHTYVRSAEPLSVYDAEVLARELGGALVAIGSAEEETFLLENFGALESYWIGLEFPRERWVTGEPLGFAHWAPAEPNDGPGAPFTLMNSDEPGAWLDASGAVDTQRYRALIEFSKGVAPGPTPLNLAARRAGRGVLLCAIQGLTAKELESARTPNLNALWKSSAWSFDAGADGSGDPLAGLGMLLLGVGSAKSRLASGGPASSNPIGATRGGSENLLTRIEGMHPDVSTIALLDDAALAGILLDGKIDVRLSNASPRKGGSQAPLSEVLARAAPLCVVAAWTKIAMPGAEEGGNEDRADADRSKDLAAIDKELGALLQTLRARAEYAEEQWWIAVAGLAPVANKKAKADDLRARTGVPLCLLAPSAPPGEILGEVALVDLVPSALRHLGIETRTSWMLDGRALTLAAPLVLGTNLLVNGGAEAQFGWVGGAFPVLTGWRTLAPFRRARHDPAEPGPPERGQSHFQGVGDGLARIEQTIDLRSLAADVERGAVRFRLAGWLGVRRQSQASIECALEFLNEQRKVLERVVLGPVGVNEMRADLGSEKGVALEGFIERQASGRIPRRARAARIVLAASGPAGVAETMADELSLVLERE